MQSLVFCVGHHLKILQSVIPPVAVDMVDVFGGCEFTTECCFHHKAVLKGVTPDAGFDLHVTTAKQ